jgi:adenylate cyclase
LLLQALPAANHIIQGGFESSGAVLCWSAITPPLAGILLQSRPALLVFFGISVTVVIICTLTTWYTEDVWSALRDSDGLDGPLQVAFFFIDISMPALILVVAIFYYDLRLSVEQMHSEALLHRIMPRRFASLLRAGRPRESLVEQYENVTCLFAEIVSFAELVENHSPSDVIATIDALFEQIDHIAIKAGVLKVATIGNVYLAVAGVPIVTDAREAAAKMANFALALRDVVTRDAERYGIRIRIGVHSGPVVAGVIGSLSPQFTLIGDSVNVASRMESTSSAGRIHCSEATYSLLVPDFTFTKRAPIPIKGKGMMQTFWLVGRLVGDSPLHSPQRSRKVKKKKLFVRFSSTHVDAGQGDGESKVSKEKLK